jgi:uncharacterized membrane-anchored protein YitT (DUF2179 family)
LPAVKRTHEFAPAIPHRLAPAQGARGRLAITLPRMKTPPHSVADDLQAFATAIVVVSLGLSLLSSAGLLTGGTPGLAFLLSHATGWPLGAALFVVNLPFYVLAWREMGARFTLRTLGAVTALSLGVEGVSHMLSMRHVQPMYAALAGGTLIGVGLLVLFRHRASLGGINVLALALQRRCGWRAGAVQMAIDLAILAAAFALVDPVRVAYSVAGSLAVNLVLLCNHRPGRYTALGT